MNVGSDQEMSRFAPGIALGKRAVPMLIAIAVVVGAIWLLAGHIRTISVQDMQKALSLIPRDRILQAILFTAVSFAGLAAYDVFAILVVAPGRAIVWRSAFAGATGNALSNTLGFHAITGALARYRIYRGAGLGRDVVTQVISLSWATLGFGFVSTLAVALLWQPDVESKIIALCLSGGLAVLLLWLSRGPRTLRIARFSVRLPTAGLAALQMIVGAVEMSAAIGALYVLVPGDLVPTFPVFTVIYIGAVLFGIVSHAPGGIGVFEATMMSALAAPGRADVFLALVLYRAIYNILPFTLAMTSLLGFEAFNWLRDFNSRADTA